MGKLLLWKISCLLKSVQWFIFLLRIFSDLFMSTLWVHSFMRLFALIVHLGAIPNKRFRSVVLKNLCNHTEIFFLLMLYTMTESKIVKLRWITLRKIITIISHYINFQLPKSQRNLTWKHLLNSVFHNLFDEGLCVLFIFWWRMRSLYAFNIFKLKKNITLFWFLVNLFKNWIFKMLFMIWKLILKFLIYLILECYFSRKKAQTSFAVSIVFS